MNIPVSIPIIIPFCRLRFAAVYPPTYAPMHNDKLDITETNGSGASNFVINNENIKRHTKIIIIPTRDELAVQ
jgi:hypothetical protein